MSRAVFDAAFPRNGFWELLSGEIIYWSTRESFTALCYGMGLLAGKVAESATGLHAAPFAGTVSEPVWRLALTTDLNDALRAYHWRQLSAGAVAAKARGRARDPAETLRMVRDDLAAGRTGLLLVSDNTRPRPGCAWLHPSGHALIPLGVTLGGGRTDLGRIAVYDPNLPYHRANAGLTALDERRHPTVRIDGSRWSYEAAGLSYDQECGHLAYVRLPGRAAFDADWTRTYGVLEALMMLFSDGATVEMIADGSGRTAWTRDGADGQLASEILRFAPLSQMRIPPVLRRAAPGDGRSAALARRWEERFGARPDIYFVVDPRLGRLSATVRGAAPGAPVSIALVRGDRTQEITLTPAAGEVLRAEVSLARADRIEAGVAVRDLTRGGATMAVEALVAERAGDVRWWRVDPAPLHGGAATIATDASRGPSLVVGGRPAAGGATLRTIGTDGAISGGR